MNICDDCASSLLFMVHRGVKIYHVQTQSICPFRYSLSVEGANGFEDIPRDQFDLRDFDPLIQEQYRLDYAPRADGSRRPWFDESAHLERARASIAALIDGDVLISGLRKYQLLNVVEPPPPAPPLVVPGSSPAAGLSLDRSMGSSYDSPGVKRRHTTH